MDSSSPKVSDELVRVIWASHILSLMNPHTIAALEKPAQPDQKVHDDDDDGEGFDDDSDQDVISTDAGLLTANYDVLRQKASIVRLNSFRMPKAHLMSRPQRSGRKKMKLKLKLLETPASARKTKRI